MIKQHNLATSKRMSVRHLFWVMAREIKIDGILKFFMSHDSYLVEQGWFASMKSKSSVDKEGNPLPWLTYPFISFIEPRLNKNMTIFEYGCGNSTIWFANRVSYIHSLENEKTWFEMIGTKLPRNAKVSLEEIDISKGYSAMTFLSCADESSYSKFISTTGELYDIILIDGVYRSNSIVNSINSLKEGGIIIVDNVDYVESFESVEFLQRLGFKKIEFWGMCPIVHDGSCTAIFYKDINCLNI